MENGVSEWFERRESRTERMDLSLVRRMAATLNLATFDETYLPLLWHWAFFQSELPFDQLGRDGHPNSGGILPPNRDRNRMWAGGSFQFIEPLKIGEETVRESKLVNMEEKSGRSGNLLFVTVEQHYQQAGKTAMIETQNIVYRDPAPPKLTSELAPAFDWSETITPNVIQLFRYSAVTFNGHRIHYDYPYATDVEGYTNLVVHGPLMATWALHSFIKAHPKKIIKCFDYRGIRPAILPESLDVGGRMIDSQKAEVWVTNKNGLIQKGNIIYADA